MSSFYETSDFRNGLKLEVDGQPFAIVYFQFVKPGKGTAFTRTKLKNLLSGTVIERTYRSGETVAAADVEEQPCEFLYAVQGVYTFMNKESFEQFELEEGALGDERRFLQENLECSVLFWRGKPVNVTLPNFIEDEVTYAEPAVAGNTSTGATKSATLKCGAQIQVPLFIKTGDVLKVDTRDGSYVSRINK